MVEVLGGAELLSRKWGKCGVWGGGGLTFALRLNVGRFVCKFKMAILIAMNYVHLKSVPF